MERTNDNGAQFSRLCDGNFRCICLLFYERRISNLREVLVGIVPRHYFNDFAVFQARDFNGNGPAFVCKFFLAFPSAPARSAPTSFLPKNSRFPALKFLHSFSVHGTAKRSGAFQYLRSILCQLSCSFFFRYVTRGSRNSTLTAIYNMEGCMIWEMEGG